METRPSVGRAQLSLELDEVGSPADAVRVFGPGPGVQVIAYDALGGIVVRPRAFEFDPPTVTGLDISIAFESLRLVHFDWNSGGRGGWYPVNGLADQSWLFVADWGDGAATGEVDYQAFPLAHTYSTPGSYDVALRVVDMSNYDTPAGASLARLVAGIAEYTQTVEVA